MIEKDLTRLSRPGWTLTTGNSDFRAAMGASRLAAEVGTHENGVPVFVVPRETCALSALGSPDRNAQVRTSQEKAVLTDSLRQRAGFAFRQCLAFRSSRLERISCRSVLGLGKAVK